MRRPTPSSRHEDGAAPRRTTQLNHFTTRDKEGEGDAGKTNADASALQREDVLQGDNHMRPSPLDDIRSGIISSSPVSG